MNAVIALNPQQMQDAQSTTLRWTDERIATAKADIAEADGLHDELQRMGVRNANAASMAAKARRRLAFYEKVKAALEAGYYIIPPFAVQLFAVRTNRENPPDERSERRWPIEVTPAALSIGTGRYVDPQPARQHLDTIQKPNYDGKGTHDVAIYENVDEWADVAIPVRALKPQLIEATGKALQEKIFDALGIAPAYRSADPIIVGQIKHYDRNKSPLTFFVAWWLDKSDL